MGARGQNRTGYYVAVLYTLEAGYQEQAQQGLAPHRWSPAPRRRPEQFLEWSSACLSTLGESPAATLPQHLKALERNHFPHVATMLKERVTNPDSLFDFEGKWERDEEKHPQVRKIAAQLRAHLDARWLELLLDLPTPESPEEALALALGGLPPNFSAVTGLLETLVKHYDPALFSPLQRFTLATGRVPDPPTAWCACLAALATLTPEDLVQLNSLSHSQLEHLRKLDRDTLALLSLRERVPCSDEQWNAFGMILPTLEQIDVTRIAAALARPGAKRLRLRLRLRQLPQRTVQEVAYLLAYWPTTSALLLDLKQLSSEATWQKAEAVSPELRRVITRGEFRPALLARLHTWSRDELENVHGFLRHEPALSWCEDACLLDELKRQRSAAWLELAEVFPASTAYLARLLSQHYCDALLADWSDLEPQARRVGERLQQAWLERVSAAGAAQGSIR